MSYIRFLTGTKGELLWNGNWVSFLDAMLQLSVLRLPGRGLRLPTRVRSLRINPSVHLEREKEGSCDIKVDPRMGMVVSGGVELHGECDYSSSLMDDLSGEERQMFFTF